MSNALQRILTAAVGIPLIVGLTYLGGWPFGLLVAVAALLAQHELYHLMQAGGLRPQHAAGLVLGALVALHGLIPVTLPLAAIGVVLLIVLYPFLKASDQPLQNLAATVFGLVYPTAFLAFLVDLREARGLTVLDREAFLLTLGVLVLIWATDTFAYYVGRSVGKRPLAPKISPKKTWEGAIGGAAGAVLTAVALRLAFPEALGFLSWPHLLVVALLCGIFSQFGDLAESKLKRSVGVKDSGTILPGHGGVLDRFDAMIVTAPLVYLYLAYVARLFS